MTDFRPDNPFVMPLPLARRKIQSGWLLQFRGRRWVSRLIQYATGGPHSHSAMAIRRASGAVDVLDVVEWTGGRTRSLEWHVARSGGRIDVFRPNAGGRWRNWDGEAAAARMRVLADGRYGYRGVARLALQRVPLVWRLWPLEVDDRTAPGGAPFCSHAVCDATRHGGVDPVPRKPDHLITPNDLTWSVFFEYQFSL